MITYFIVSNMTAFEKRRQGVLDVSEGLSRKPDSEGGDGSSSSTTSASSTRESRSSRRSRSSWISSATTGSLRCRQREGVGRTPHQRLESVDTQRDGGGLQPQSVREQHRRNLRRRVESAPRYCAQGEPPVGRQGRRQWGRPVRHRRRLRILDLHAARVDIETGHSVSRHRYSHAAARSGG